MTGKLTATVLDVAQAPLPCHVRGRCDCIFCCWLVFLRCLKYISRQGVLGETLEEDAPLMEAGLDSLSAVDFRNQAGTCTKFEACLVCYFERLSQIRWQSSCLG